MPRSCLCKCCPRSFCILSQRYLYQAPFGAAVELLQGRSPLFSIVWGGGGSAECRDIPRKRKVAFLLFTPLPSSRYTHPKPIRPAFSSSQATNFYPLLLFSSECRPPPRTQPRFSYPWLPPLADRKAFTTCRTGFDCSSSSRSSRLSSSSDGGRSPDGARSVSRLRHHHLLDGFASARARSFLVNHGGDLRLCACGAGARAGDWSCYNECKAGIDNCYHNNAGFSSHRRVFCAEGSNLHEMVEIHIVYCLLLQAINFYRASSHNHDIIGNREVEVEGQVSIMTSIAAWVIMFFGYRILAYAALRRIKVIIMEM